MFWHQLTHRFRQKLWTDIETLPVPGYAGTLRRQRCTCGITRVQEIPR